MRDGEPVWHTAASMSSGEQGESGAGVGPVSATLLAPTSEARPDKLLHYRVLGMLGQGVMGAVYKAEDQRLGRIVAIKRVTGRERTEDDTAQRRLLQEARAASALSHPNIVTVFAIEEADGDAFIVMEYVEGETLAARIARGPLEPTTVLAIGAEVADALACAHAAGLIHRDVKPANVMITARGAAKVLDFGIAKPVSRGAPSDAAGLTASGMIVGSVSYMSPEQLRAQPLDGRADVFALGCTLYEALTAHRAFPGGDLVTLVHQITVLDPVPPRALVPTVPAAIEAIVLRALSKNPTHRFASAAEMAAALRAAARGVTGVVTEEPSIPSRSRDAPSSIAVLSFLDLSPARDQDYLCDGIAEEILTSLTHVEGLRVAPRSSSFQFKSKAVDARTVGARLGVEVVLEGAVRKAGDRLRVTAQLVDVAGGYQRWSHRFDGAVADVFAIQDEIAAKVATLLRGFLGTDARKALRRPGTTAEAYEHFLRGRQLLYKWTAPSLLASEESLQRSIRIDPDYAPAYALLAQLHAFSAEWLAGGDAARDAADRASARALELAPELAEAHIARAAAHAMRREYAAAGHEYQEAIRLYPQSFDAHYHAARVCFQSGDDARAAELFKRGGEIQPEDFQCLILAGYPLRRLGRDDDALASLREGLRRAERALDLDPKNTRALSLGPAAWVVLGEPERALEWCRRSVEAAPDDPGVLHNAACLHARMGKTDAAFDILEQTLGRGLGKRDWVEHDPDLDSLRYDPRFQALLAKLP